jgi:hypothetical protein
VSVNKKRERRENGSISRKEKIIKNIPEITDWLNNNWMQLIINSKKVCTTNYRLWGEDLLLFVIGEFLEKDEEYQIKIYNQNKIEHWITSSMSLQIKSSTSPFYYKYRRPLINERSDKIKDIKNDDSPDREKIVTKLRETVSRLDGIEKYIAENYIYKQQTVKSLSEELNLPKKKINKIIINIKQKIKQECQNYPVQLYSMGLLQNSNSLI